MATGSFSWDMMQRRPRAKLGGVSLNLGTKSQLVSVEGISEADAEKIMDLRCSWRELSFTTLLLETAITEEQMLQWARDKVVMGHFRDFDLEVDPFLLITWGKQWLSFPWRWRSCPTGWQVWRTGSISCLATSGMLVTQRIEAWHWRRNFLLHKISSSSQWKANRRSEWQGWLRNMRRWWLGWLKNTSLFGTQWGLSSQCRTGPSLLSSRGRIKFLRNCRTGMLNCTQLDRRRHQSHRLAGITGMERYGRSMISC